MPQSTESFVSHVHFHAAADIQLEAGSLQYNLAAAHLHISYLDMFIDDAGICSALIIDTCLSILQYAESAFAFSGAQGELQKRNARNVASNRIPLEATKIPYV